MVVIKSLNYGVLGCLSQRENMLALVTQIINYGKQSVTLTFMVKDIKIIIQMHLNYDISINIGPR